MALSALLVGAGNVQLVAWNMRGYTATKLQQLIHGTPHPSRPVLAYLL